MFKRIFCCKQDQPVQDSADMKEKVFITDRVKGLKERAAARFGVSPSDCHVGHVTLQAMLEEPDLTHQIDSHTDGRESNASVALRSCKLASAIRNYGLVPGDTVVIIGPNHLDLCIPYFASHFNGHQMCAMDPSVIASDLQILFSYIYPKMVFCPKSHVDNVQKALDKGNFEAKVICFDDEENSVEKFVQQYRGTEVNYKPAVIDQKKLNAWLMMTSGTTGLPKLAMIPYETLLTGLCSWWSHFTDRIHVNMAMGTIQWMSSLIFFISGPLMRYTRVQSTVSLTPQLLVKLINTYKPNATAWTPHMLGKFIEAAGDFCDLSSFIYIAIGGSSIEKPLLDAFKKKCGAFLFLVYGMTELLVPVFDYNDSTPFGSTGKELAKFQYRLVSDAGDALDKASNATGELWIKGEEFFKGYLNNPEETDKVITADGWVKTGDMFYRDQQGYYYFVERKRLMIKCRGLLVSPLQLEEVIKQHPGVHDACVVGLPDPAYMELPVAAVVRNDKPLDPEEIFDLLKSKLSEYKQLYGGLFYMDSLPTTPSGKVHRAKIREIAFVTPRIVPKQTSKI